MFEPKCVQIKLNETDSYPMKFDNYVLEQVQNKYGTINKFEFLIKGYRYKKENNEFLLDENGNKLIEIIEPSIETMNYVLPLMIREGMEIEGKELDVSDKQLIRSINRPYFELINEIIQEFKRCFTTSKK